MQNARIFKSRGWEPGRVQLPSGVQPLELKPVLSCISGAEDLPDEKPYFALIM